MLINKLHISPRQEPVPCPPVPNKKEYWNSRTPLPVTYEELLPGAYRIITLALVEGQFIATIHFSWDDEYKNENKQYQTIDL
jgi:hypothetical protein